MLKLENGIRINGRVLWVFVLILVTMTGAIAADPTYIRADTVVVMNKYGMGAPFLVSWTPVWVFAMAGGIGANFIKIPEIDKHFRFLLLAKPFLGLFGGIALCLFISDGSEPPKVALTAYALISSLLSAPILQGAIAVVTIPKNQAGFLNSVNPFKFKVVVADDKHREPKDGTDNQ